MNTKLTNAHSTGSIGELEAASLSLHELFLKDPSLSESEKQIISEFVHLIDKSKQLFNGLRDLPQYGHKNSQWQAYFGRTFDVYTKLWKFQQQHRQILDAKYNLKRWQIGDIASKIGQLYYHYYLRTSESNYLNEAYSFYNAIQIRSYYSKVNKEEKSDLMVKKLRYMARFIVVCLLLKKTKQVKDLIKELGKQIDDYVKIYDPEDALEWQLVRNEINDFIEADNLLYVDNSLLTISNRLKIAKNASKAPQNSHLSLGEVVIIGNCKNQIKFSELSLDMYRMLQAVEREPNLSESQIAEKSNSNKDHDYHTPVQRDNSHKYLLYKPSISQSLAFIASAFKDLQPHAVMMIYISADSCESNAKIKLDSAYDHGGVHTNNKKDSSVGQINEASLIKKSSNLKEVHCLFPGDLYAYMRKPMFLIVDSSNSNAFQSIPQLFGQPFLSFLSPTRLPQMFHENSFKGNLFTLFLSNSLLAFCFVCDLNNLAQASMYERALKQIDQIHNEISNMLLTSRQIDHVFVQFMSDEFLRSFIVRFVFCCYVLKNHRGFTRAQEFLPSSQPKLPIETLENPVIGKMILDLATLLEVQHVFVDTNEMDD